MTHNIKNTITTQSNAPEIQDWDKLVLGLGTAAHYMQSSAWGQSKSLSLWPVSRVVVNSKNVTLPVQVFSRTVPGLGRLHYAPEVAGVDKGIISALTEEVSKQYSKGLAFKIELYQPYSEDIISAFEANGWVRGNSVQYRNTVIVDLSGTEKDLFTRMKRRARYEVGLAQRSGVKVEKAEVNQKSLNTLASLMDLTAKRSGAFFRKPSYSNKYWHAFNKYNQGSIYFARHDNDLLAGAFVITFGKCAWYKDGGSDRKKSNLMAPRFLQWEIMRNLQSQDLKQYDLSGIPAVEDLETSSLKGLYTFKTGFSNQTVRLMPAMELPFGKRYTLWPKAEHQFLRLYSGLKKDFWY